VDAIESLIPAGAHWIIDRATRNPALQAQFKSLGGTWIPQSKAWEFTDPNKAALAETVLDTFLDQTVVIDPNALYVRDLLTSKRPEHTRIYGGEQIQLSDGRYAYEFPSTRHAANAVALVYSARQLTPAHRAGLQISRELLAPEAVAQIFGDHAHTDDASIDRYTATQILERAKEHLYELGVSPSHQRNLERLAVVIESFPRNELTTMLGFDPAYEPLNHERLSADPVTTAKAIRDATPKAKELGINIDALLHERRVAIDRAIASGAQPGAVGLDEAQFNERQDTISKRVRAPIPTATAPTALASEERAQQSGAYVDDEKERLGAERSVDGEERLRVTQRLRDALEIDNVPIGEEVALEPGEWLQGRIVSYSNAHENDGRGEFIGLQVTARARADAGCVASVPAGSQVVSTPVSLKISRPTGGTLVYNIEPTPDKQFVIVAAVGQQKKQSDPYPTAEAAKEHLAKIAGEARVSAGLENHYAQTTGYAILPATRFAGDAFRNQNLERAGRAKYGIPVTLAPQADGKLVVMYGHHQRPPVAILHNDEHAVPRPKEREMIADYQDVLALSKAQAAAFSLELVERERARAAQDHREPKEYAKRPAREAARVAERVVPKDCPAGLECEILNVGKYYVGTRNRWDVMIHDRFAFDANELTVGAKKVLVYEALNANESIVHVQDAVAPVAYSRVSEAHLLSVPSNEFDPALLAEGQEITNAALDLLERCKEELARHEAQPEIAHEPLGKRLVRPKEQDHITGDVLRVDKTAGAVVIARTIDGQPVYTAVPLHALRNGQPLGYLDRVQISKDGENIELTGHQTRSERVAEFVHKVGAKIAKERTEKGAELRQPFHTINDTYQGDVVAIDPRTQTVVVAADARSISSYDLTKIERPLALGDSITITRDKFHHDERYVITAHTRSNDRSLESDNKLSQEIEATQSAAMAR
jgi:hypothetical protein